MIYILHCFLGVSLISAATVQQDVPIKVEGSRQVMKIQSLYAYESS